MLFNYFIIGYVIIWCVIVLLSIYDVNKNQSFKLIIKDILFNSLVGLYPIFNVMLLYFLCDKLLEKHCNSYKTYKHQQDFYK